MLGSAMFREASWNKSNFFWATFRCKRPNAILAANSGFDQPSMIALALSRILELGVTVLEELPTYRVVDQIEMPDAATSTDSPLNSH